MNEPTDTPAAAPDEPLAAAFGSLANSLAQGLRAAGVAQGMEPDFAAAIAAQVMTGSVALLEAGDASPRELLARVTSKGGITAAGVAVLDAGGALDAAIARALAGSATRPADGT